MYDVSTTNRRAWWFPAMAVAIVLALMWTPVVAAGVNAASAQDQSSPAASQSFAGLSEAPSAGDKIESANDAAGALDSALPKRIAPLPVVASTPADDDATDRTGNDGSAKRAVPTASQTSATSSPRVAAARPTAASASTAAGRSSSSGADELGRARSILAGLIAQHPILAGTTVSIGSTPGGYQAVAYYKSGRILVSPNHSSSLERILRHEIWHVIDWRDNGHIDWGESVPPK